MEVFEREYPDSVYYHEKLSDDAGTLGTPLHRDGPNFTKFMQNLEGYQSDAYAYIYVIVLERSTDSSAWYYVGQALRETGLKRRLSCHVRSFSPSRPIRQHGEDVLKGDKSTKNYVKTEKYRVTGIDRIESIELDDIGFNADGKWGTSHARRQHRESYIEERERKMAYQVALDYSTTNVLGGK